MYCMSIVVTAGGEKFILTLNERDKVLPTVFFGRLFSFHFFALFISFFNSFIRRIHAECENMKKIFVRN